MIDCIGPKVAEYKNTKIEEYRNGAGNKNLDCGTFIWVVLLLEIGILGLPYFYYPRYFY